MIAELTGKVVHRTPEYLILDVHGVGYKVHVPLSTYYRITQDGQEIRLNIYTHLGIDTHRQRGTIDLYGFSMKEERAAFELLLTVPRVSPRLARNILSGITVEDLVQAVYRGDTAKLKAIPGVGAKHSEELIRGLKDRIAELGPAGRSAGEPGGEATGLAGDVLSALLNLGYKRSQAEETVGRVVKNSGPGATVEDLIKMALRILTR